MASSPGISPGSHEEPPLDIGRTPVSKGKQASGAVVPSCRPHPVFRCRRPVTLPDEGPRCRPVAHGLLALALTARELVVGYVGVAGQLGLAGRLQDRVQAAPTA